MKKLADEIIAGRRLNRNDNLDFLLTADLKELCEGSDKIRKELCGDKVDLCTIINGRSGRCSENCKFCAQSTHHKAEVKEYNFLDPEIILEDCKKNEKNGVHRYSIVTAGRALTGEDFQKAVQSYEMMNKECSINLCASHGFLTEEEFMKLKEAGVSMYHANIETSKNNFHNICTTHSYEDKIKEIKLAQKVGLKVCSGGIIGMGETWKDRIDMAISLSELNVISIPINVLMPIKGTPFENLERIPEEDILRTIAIFRYINPTAYIRMAAGRTYFTDGGTKIFRSGANATITGDMLTTVGNNTFQDKIMLTNLGFDIKR
ncbi:biotin synthase BioB [Clostridium chromiireducens]|uniref:Biotin synthase n=1 Tax=Clostridium chromiireducens TaxID=225345 RepID=A0A1V4IV52_9CLOT|nr:biotin synthase BioB [Clostridium chromiireducens]OPJ63297.1 biotin synthase [Clostridium chromiireducens]RII33841.1 biotin synthase BioB [Clostridium chromiireducens]